MITNRNFTSGTETCRFCGQQVMIPDGHEGEPAENFCSCAQAKKIRWREERLKAASDMIQEGIIGDGDSTPSGDVSLPDEIAQLMQVTAVMMIDGKISEIRLRIGDQKVTMKRGKDEKLILQRTVQPQTTTLSE